MNKTLVEILHAAERAKRKHPEEYRDLHQVDDLLFEEYEEFTNEFVYGAYHRNRAREELLDIAAVVYRALENESLWREPK